MPSRALMFQGTASDVGKSVLVAALCRLARRQGLSVAPFKPQNMSNNAAACPDGGEIGRAQALQARAAGIVPTVDMNPVLLKPESDQRAQVVVHGHALSSMAARDYMTAERGKLLSAVCESFTRLSSQHDLVLVEGAGSPAEINLRRGDIANMGFARAAGVPVCLIGDIDRGGVIASLAGTQRVLAPEDAAMIKACLINRFRGDPSLFDDGVTAIESFTRWPCLGVVPWLAACARLPAEDSVRMPLESRARHPQERYIVAAPMLSRMANHDDADPLIAEPGVDFRWVPPGQAIPRADLIILFGSKSTIAELDFIEQQGWHHDILAHARRGGQVLGLCGGYQMLGREIADPEGYDGAPMTRPGLGLLDISTRMQADKRVEPVEARCLRSDAPVKAYEIHSGKTQGPDTARPLFKQLGTEALDGARSANGRIAGSYLHGIFSNDAFRQNWLQSLGAHADPRHVAEEYVEDAIDAVADGVAAAIDVEALFALAANS